MKNLKLLLVLLFTLTIHYVSIAQVKKQQNKALLVMDMQEPILKQLNPSITKQVAKTIEYARIQNIPIIYIRAVMRKGAPEINTNNKFFSSHRLVLESVNPEEWAKISKEISPKEHDIIVDKRRFGAFEGTDLDLILRSKGYTSLILTGVVTSGVVLSTVREAADKDYHITVISDACSDINEETHNFLMKNIFPLQADVLSFDQWSKSK